jgi:hypothetical protein
LKSISHLPLHQLPDSTQVNTFLKFFEKIGSNPSEDIWNISQMGMRNSMLNRLLLPHWQYNPNTLQRLFQTFPQDNPLTLARLWDKQIALEGDMLVKTDRMSMRASIEYRTPFCQKAFGSFHKNFPIHYSSRRELLNMY